MRIVYIVKDDIWVYIITCTCFVSTEKKKKNRILFVLCFEKRGVGTIQTNTHKHILHHTKTNSHINMKIFYVIFYLTHLFNQELDAVLLLDVKLCIRLLINGS